VQLTNFYALSAEHN